MAVIAEPNEANPQRRAARPTSIAKQDILDWARGGEHPRVDREPSGRFCMQIEQTPQSLALVGQIVTQASAPVPAGSQ